MAQTISPTLSEITPAEWEVMRVIWAQQETTSHFVIETLADKMNWKSTTIKTLLGRLVKKNWLSTTKDKNRFLYAANISEEDALNNEIAQLLASTCSTKADDVIIQTIAQATLDAAMLKRIQTALDQKTAVAAVACNCVPGQCSCNCH